jgi:hypothetical protein
VLVVPVAAAVGGTSHSCSDRTPADLRHPVGTARAGSGAWVAVVAAAGGLRSRGWRAQAEGASRQVGQKAGSVAAGWATAGVAVVAAGEAGLAGVDLVAVGPVEVGAV